MLGHVTYRRFWAYFCAWLLLSVSGLGLLHTIVAHADCHAADICVISAGHSETHVHDARYAADDCALCDFLTTHLDAPPIWYWSLPKQIIAEKDDFTLISVCLASQDKGWYPSRGPPV